MIDTKQVVELPLNGRDFRQMMALTPGVIGTSVNGQWTDGNTFQLDGAINNTVLGTTSAVLPIIDSIQEFKVQSHNDKAEYGSVLGAVVNVVSRSGGNTPHGSAWEFVRNNSLNARNPFTDVNSKSPAPFRQNQYGATFGGPIYLPKVYDGRNKTFFLLRL